MDERHVSLAGISLFVHDLERAERFYCQAFGFAVHGREDRDGFHEVLLRGNGDTTLLTLIQSNDVLGLDDRSPGAASLVLHAEGVSECFTRAIGMGAEGVREPKHDPHSNVSFAELRDPDGNPIVLVSPPSSRRERDSPPGP